MDYPEGFKRKVEDFAGLEYDNPSTSNDFGERLKEMILTETGQHLSDELVTEFNNWYIPSWRQFVNWVWDKIKKWWKELWE